MSKPRNKPQCRSSSKKYLSERDERILLFLWKFKIATARMLFARFFPERSHETAYWALRRLMRTGLIQYYSGQYGHQFALTLTRRGFDCVLPRLPALQENGFKTEAPSHDLLCTAALLGNWITDTPTGVETFTEQQIRRFKLANYPGFVPECKEHRPDGIWKLPNGNSPATIALEVELSMKTKIEYQEIARYYRGQKKVERIHWLVPTKSVARKINDHLSYFNSPDGSRHNFTLVDDFIRKEWGSRIFIGPDIGRTIYESLSTYLPHHSNKCSPKVTLDLSKKPLFSNNYKLFDYVGFSR